MKYSRLIVFFIVYIIGCRFEPEIAHKSVVKIEPAYANEINLSSVCSKIDIIPLENIEGGYLSEPKKLIIIDNQYFILDDIQKELFCFNKQGKYIRNSKNIKGNGPGEYISAVDFEYYPAANGFVILDAVGLKLLIIDKNFQYRETINFDKELLPITYFTHLRDSMFIFKGMGNQYITWLNTGTGEMGKKNLPESTGNKMFKANINHFIRFDPDLYYNHNDASNTIYKINRENLEFTDFLTIDFGNGYLPPSRVKQGSFNDFLKNSSDKYALLQSFIETENHHVIHFIHNKMYYMSIVNKLNNEGKTFYMKPGSMSQLPIPIMAKGNDIYYISAAIEIKYWIREEILTSGSKELLKNINPEDNHVIIKYTLKN